tara:strand:- start:3048 stop:3773 length:726 start_codon:yes stop_codon:yes gene_type:complete
MKFTKETIESLIKEEMEKVLPEAATLTHQAKKARQDYLNSLPESDRAAYEEWEMLSLEEPGSWEEAQPINDRMEELKPIVMPIKRELAAIGKASASERKPEPDRTYGGWQGTQGGGIRGTEKGPDDYAQMYEKKFTKETIAALIREETEKLKLEGIGPAASGLKMSFAKKQGDILMQIHELIGQARMNKSFGFAPKATTPTMIAVFELVDQLKAVAMAPRTPGAAAPHGSIAAGPEADEEM